MLIALYDCDGEIVGQADISGIRFAACEDGFVNAELVTIATPSRRIAASFKLLDGLGRVLMHGTFSRKNAPGDYLCFSPGKLLFNLYIAKDQSGALPLPVFNITSRSQ